MRFAVVTFLALSGTASADKCTGKPRTISELREQWFGGPDHVWPRRVTTPYDKRTRPNLAQRWDDHDVNADGKPPEAVADPVWAVLQVRQLEGLDMKAQTFQLDTQVRVFWYDRRLKYDPDCIQLDDLDSISFGAGLGNDIWKPDLEFKESVGVDKVARDGFWIAPSGRVWWSRKIFLTLSCRMSFADMPYDTQRCPITLTGYQHGATEIELKIPYDVKATGLTHASVVTAPTFINGPIRAACQKAGSLEWQMTNINGSNSSSMSGDSATSSTFINYDIHLTRSPGFVMQNAVFPTILVVCVAWTSFFIERGAVPARVAVVLIAYLTVSGITSAVTATLPRSPEPAWIINVLWMSRIFVFLAIFEYAIANYLKRAEARITKAMPAAKEALKQKNITYASPPIPVALDKLVRDALKQADVDPEKLRPYAEDGPFLDHPFLDKVLQEAGVDALGTRLKAIEALVHPPAKHGALQKSARKSAETDQVEVQVEDVSHYQETSTTPPGTAQQLIQQVRKSKLVTRADRKLIMATTKGRRSIVGHGEVKMCIRDQDVDIFCRYAFPLVYFVTFVALWLALPNQPKVAPFISGACL